MALPPSVSERDDQSDPCQRSGRFGEGGGASRSNGKDYRGRLRTGGSCGSCGERTTCCTAQVITRAAAHHDLVTATATATITAAVANTPITTAANTATTIAATTVATPPLPAFGAQGYLPLPLI